MLNSYPDILTIDEVMEILYIGRNTFYKLLETKKLRGFKVGRSWRITKQELIKFLSQ